MSYKTRRRKGTQNEDKELQHELFATAWNYATAYQEVQEARDTAIRDAFRLGNQSVSHAFIQGQG